MRIFVTGASGYVGSAVAEALRRRGHWVAGLVRTESKRRALEAREIRTIQGDMRAPESFLQLAREADVWIHCAAELSKDWETLDRLTVTAFLDLAAKSERARALVYTSGVWLYGNTGSNLVNESVALVSGGILPWRLEHEKRILSAARPGLRTAVIRPGCVYGGRGGLTGMWFESARRGNAAQMIGDGANRWAMIHIEDLADLYARAVEQRLSGELFNATDRSRFTVRDMAEAASRAAGAGGRVTSLDPEEAARTYGLLAQGLLLDQHVDSSKAVHLLGWMPRFGGFSENAARYFQAWRAYHGERN
jgi:nucleoside-diphosphate-sugar epimerase